MAIGERIRFFRNMKGITQKYLGMVVGFPAAVLMSGLLSMRVMSEHRKRIL